MQLYIWLRTPTHGLFSAQIYINEHSERRICRFIAPISQSKPIGFGMQNGTNCNTNSGNTQHNFRDYVESGTINRPLRLRNQRGKIQQRTHCEASLPIHCTHIINKSNWFWYAKWYKLRYQQWKYAT